MPDFLFKGSFAEPEALPSADCLLQYPFTRMLIELCSCGIQDISVVACGHVVPLPLVLMHFVCVDY
jgi:hypothetical protein